MSTDQEGASTAETTAGEIMKREFVTITPDKTVKELVDVLTEHDLSGVPVVDDTGTLVGIVTEGDIVAEDAELHFPHYIQFLDSVIYLESMSKFEDRLRKAMAVSVADLMTDEVFTVKSSDPVGRVATIMSKHKIGQVPVVDDGRLVGIVTRHEVIGSLGL